MLVQGRDPLRDVEVTADVGYAHDEAHAAAGIAFRLGEDATGYAVGLREVEKGVHPEFGPWERPVIQLFRMDRDGWKLLQESKVIGCRSGLLRRLKVVCRGPNIWAYYEDMTTPVLTEFDDRYDRAGAVGLWKDRLGAGSFDNVQIAPASSTPPPPLRTDWSWVRGAVYVRSDAVNSVQMWHDYWGHTDVIDRELSYASLYGFNMVQVYLHWIVWDRHGEEYLKRIDDFLARASKAGLKVNFILWDDCGHVEPSLTFADPVPGRHNSQMMMNPSHRIRDSEAELLAHKDRFKDYVEGVVRRFKDDERIAFWQLYNEGMGPKEKYRSRRGRRQPEPTPRLDPRLGQGDRHEDSGHRHRRRLLRPQVFRLLHVPLLRIRKQSLAECRRRPRASLHRDAQPARHGHRGLPTRPGGKAERFRRLGADGRAGQLPLPLGPPRRPRRAGRAVPRRGLPGRASLGRRRGQGPVGRCRLRLAGDEGIPGRVFRRPIQGEQEDLDHAAHRLRPG